MELYIQSTGGKKTFQPGVPAKLFFRNETEIKFFLYKQNLREFIITMPILQNNAQGTPISRSENMIIIIMKAHKVMKFTNIVDSKRRKRKEF